MGVQPQPPLNFAEHPLAAVVDGDDVSRPFGPYELFFCRTKLLECEFCNTRRDTGIFARLNYQCRRSYPRKRFTGAADYLPKLEQRTSRDGSVSKILFAFNRIVN